MWRFDQGRIEYFQFDELRKIAKFAIANDLKSASRGPLVSATGLPFLPANAAYPPWRNYSRVFRTAMLVAKIGNVARPTRVAELLARDGVVTSDDYFHFFAQAFTDPAPSFQEWTPSQSPRFPLLFALKFLLARSVLGEPVVAIREIVGAYSKSGFDGDEDQSAYLGLAKKQWSSGDHRQARESIQIIGQLSYLSASSSEVTVSLEDDDALDLFESLQAIRGKQRGDSEHEIMRIAGLFESAVAGLDIDFSKTVFDDAVETGFTEGTRVEKTHIVLERNSAIRKAFFDKNPTTTCDFCARDTNSEFPWSDRVLDIHHVLPLCSGTRSDRSGTVLGDLVAVCPTCHRAIHRFYTQWLKAHSKKDFADAAEARAVYDEAKSKRKNA